MQNIIILVALAAAAGIVTCFLVAFDRFKHVSSGGNEQVLRDRASYLVINAPTTKNAWFLDGERCCNSLDLRTAGPATPITYIFERGRETFRRENINYGTVRRDWR